MSTNPTPLTVREMARLGGLARARNMDPVARREHCIKIAKLPRKRKPKTHTSS